MAGGRGAKRTAANVDRYGKNNRDEEVAADDASVNSAGDESEMEPEADNEGGEAHETPKEWTLPDGSPVFRIGKKSLRLDPRRNRRGNGEDSSELDTDEERENAADSEFEDNSPVVPLIPSPTVLRAPKRSAAPTRAPQPTAPAAQKVPERASQKPAQQPRSSSDKKKEPSQLYASPLLLLLLLLALLLGATIMFFLFQSYWPAIILTPAGLTNATIINPIISSSPAVVDAHRKIEELKNESNEKLSSLSKKLQEIDGKLHEMDSNIRRDLKAANDKSNKEILEKIDKDHKDAADRLNKQREELIKEIAALKKHVNEEMAKKLDISDFEKKLAPGLEAAREKLSKEIQLLAARIKVLEDKPSAPVTTNPTGNPSGTPASSDAINKLSNELNTLKNEQKKMDAVVEALRSAEKETKAQIANLLSTPAADQAIVTIINKYLTTGSDAKMRESIQKLAFDVVTQSKDFKHLLREVAELTVKANTLTNDMATNKNTIDKTAASLETLTGAEVKNEKRISTLETKVATLQSQTTPNPNPTGTPTVGAAELAALTQRVNELEAKLGSNNGKDEAAISALRSELQTLNAKTNDIANNVNQVDSRRIGDKEELMKKIEESVAKLESRIRDFSSNPGSGSNPGSSNPENAIPASQLETIRQFVVDEISKKVSGATSSSVGQADHALYTNGARVILAGTGWNPSVSWPSSSGGGLLGLFGLFSKTPSKNVPSVALEPTMTPGFCWPFPGNQANFSVGLSCKVAPTAFTIDHIPFSEAIHPGSMPKEFSVYGIKLAEANSFTSAQRVVLIANAEYRRDGPTAQTFNVDKNALTGQEFDAYTLEIRSNYGEKTYTCLYRFRVHGKRSPRCDIHGNVKDLQQETA